MTIPADALKRKGYRLPTEAEWEYACRAGAITSRYYGRSLDLLGKYSWFQANSRGRTWPCGERIPNDLGLFDMLGNQFEWCHNREYFYEPGQDGTVVDDAKGPQTVDGRAALHHARQFLQQAAGACPLGLPLDVRAGNP